MKQFKIAPQELDGLHLAPLEDRRVSIFSADGWIIYQKSLPRETRNIHERRRFKEHEKSLHNDLE